MEELISKIKVCAEEVFHELGVGHLETVYHNALSCEFRAAHILYQTQVNLEVFYKKQLVGLVRPDFVLTTDDNTSTTKTLVVELKVGSGSCLENLSTCTRTQYINQVGKYIKNCPSCSAALLIYFGTCNVSFYYIEENNVTFF